jgi:xanthine dehydrogenase YagS FAD-binding subunit
MQQFSIQTPASLPAAEAAARADGASLLAGGTDLMQLMKNGVVEPQTMVDLDRLELSRISVSPEGLRLGATATMADVAAHPEVRRSWPAISQALLLSASPQVRNMGTMAGNLLQRTRCGYFRNTGFACNKREPGSGCPAIAGDNRELAILGGSEHCIATHPSDMPVALVALGASVEVSRGGRTHRIRLADLYRLPGDTPHVETSLQPGDVVTAIVVPASAAAKGSHYVKVRDRTSFAFALVSAAVALDVQDGVIREAGVAAGGVGTKPWHLPEVEQALRGKPAREATLHAAAECAGEGAKPASENGFKLVLLRRVVLRALQTATA